MDQGIRLRACNIQIVIKIKTCVERGTGIKPLASAIVEEMIRSRLKPQIHVQASNAHVVFMIKQAALHRKRDLW